MRAALRAALVLLAVPAALGAQQSGLRRSGFHAAVGLGAGSAGVSCDDCGTDRETGLALMLRFGGAIRPDVVLSGEINGWSKEYQESGGRATATLSWLNFAAQWYPQPSRGFYVKGGVGLAVISFDVVITGFGSAKLERTGAGIVVGTGWDIPVSRSFALTPFVDYLWAAKADAKINGSSGNGQLGGDLLHVGIAATWP